MKHIKIYEEYSLNEYYEHLKGYTMQGNKEKQEPSGYVVGDKVFYDFKNTKTGEVVQSMPGDVIEVYSSEDGDYVVVVKTENGTKWLFGSDDNKFHNMEDLRKA